MRLEYVDKIEVDNIGELLGELPIDEKYNKFNEEYIKKAEKDGVCDADIMYEIMEINRAFDEVVDVKWLEGAEYWEIMVWKIIPDSAKGLKKYYKRWYLKLRLRGE